MSIRHNWVCVECFDSLKRHGSPGSIQFPSVTEPIKASQRTTERAREKRHKKTKIRLTTTEKCKWIFRSESEMGDNIDWIDSVPRPNRYLNCAIEAMKMEKEEKRFCGKIDFRFKNAIHFPAVFSSLPSPPLVAPIQNHSSSWNINLLSILNIFQLSQKNFWFDCKM